MKNPFSAIVGGVRAVYRKADNAISKERDEELGEVTQAVLLKGVETLAEVMPTPAALLAGEEIEFVVKVQMRRRSG